MQSHEAGQVYRVACAIGFLATLVGAGFVYILASFAEGSYEEAVRDEPWEWAVVASVAGMVAAVVAIRGLVARSRTSVRVGALAQAISALIVLAVALPTFDDDWTEIERWFVAVTIAVLLFDVCAFVGSWVVQRWARLV